jgi:hypothetical protein
MGITWGTGSRFGRIRFLSLLPGQLEYGPDFVYRGLRVSPQVETGMIDNLMIADWRVVLLVLQQEDESSSGRSSKHTWLL